MKNRLSIILSSLALVVALTSANATAVMQFITGANIRNNTITTKDMRNNTIKSVDLGAESVATSDIGEGQVTAPDIGTGEVKPSDLELPPPETLDPPDKAAPASSQYELLATVGTYSKASAESVLQVEWSGIVESGSGTNCIFQLRVNGIEPPAGGEVFSTNVPVNVSTGSLYPGLPVGPATIEIWAKVSAAVVPNPSCVVGSAQIDSSVRVVEIIT